ncbi:MAG: hypothetical protein WC749_16815, partial [Dehalococcoidia bacterium]
MLIFVILMTLVSLRRAIAGAPQYTPNIHGMVFNVSQDRILYFDVNATDPENDSYVFTNTPYID